MSLAGLNLPYGRELTAADLDQIPWRNAKFELLGGQLVVSSDWRPFSAADLDEVPDDGHVYEVINGTLFVSAAPSTRHQRVVWNLARLIDDVVREGLDPFTAPYEVFLDDETRIQPDLLVADPVAVEPQGVVGAPLLAIEVSSPSTRLKDLMAKKEALRAAGCRHYWVVDPDEPSVLAWELVEGEYVEAGRAVGEETMRLERPFPVEVTPQRLIER